MKISLIQIAPVWEDRDANLAGAALHIRRAAASGADVAVLPEMFTTGFTMNLSALEPEAEGAAEGALSALAREHGINVIAGYAVRASSSGRGMNLGAAFDRKGRRVGLYRKLHPFPLSGEHLHFQSGEGPVAFELDGIASSMFICYDLRFPEDFRRVAARVKVIYVLANWPASRAPHWETLLRARAIENQCFVAGVNRSGTDGNGILYKGGSAIFGPMGEELAEGGEGEQLVEGTADPSEVEKVRAEYPFLKDMNI